MRVGVIGAGPAGLTTALALARGGAEVDVFEAADRVGGLCRTIELWGQHVDIGPHRFFSADRRINEFWLDIVGDDYEMIDRLTRVVFRDKLIDYPIRPFGALRKLGPFEAARCLASYLGGKVLHQAIDEDQSFEDWVTRRFGRRLFEVFFQSYSEKLWGIPCRELSADFAAQRIREFSLWEAMTSTISKKRKDRHKTLADRFAYPTGGTGVVYDRIANEIATLGGRLHTGKPVATVKREQTRVTGLEFTDGEHLPFDHVVSTMPLTLLVQCLHGESVPVPTPVRKASLSLQFRNTLLIYLHIETRDLFDDQWLYVQSPHVRTGRITNFRNWRGHERESRSDLENENTILAVEQWCNGDDPHWRRGDSDLIELATEELRELGILDQQRVLAGHVLRIEKSYPVYRRGYEQHVATITEYLSEIEGITAVGRGGAFKYNNQDHSILMGLLAAENILGNAGHDLWDVNSDFDRFQEQALITATGLTSLPSTRTNQFGNAR